MSSTGAVKVTVLMTLYNKAAFVEEAIRSILDQTFTDFELLVVDDRSTDNGPDIVRGIHDPRIRLVRNPTNLGRAGAANRGYSEARGEYIAVLDADDIAHPERLERQVRFMDEHPDVDVSGTYCQRFGSLNRISKWPAEDRGCKGRMFFTDPVWYGSCIIRRDLFLRTGIRSDEQWRLPAEDYLLMLRLGPHARFANIPLVLNHYRMGEQNQRYGRDAFADRRAICRRAFEIKQIPVSEEELDLHLLFFLLTRTPVTQARVKQFHDWMFKLGRMNVEMGLFPSFEFNDEMSRRWMRFFFLAADHGLRSGIEHMRLSGKWPRDRVLYLIKSALKRRIKRWSAP